MTDESNDQHDNDELQRLREHNKQLLAELKTARTEAKTLQDAAEAATTRANEWQARWYAQAVERPLEDDLRGAAAGPWKYLRDVCIEQKLLTMEPDDEGIERPVWRDEKGDPADLSRGLHRFLCGVYDRMPGSDLGHMLRGSGVSGSGAPGSGRVTAPAPTMPPAAPAPVAPPLGLR